MKKQANRCVKAYLLRGALYLLLLLGVCLIPFAFSQRLIIQRAAPHVAPSQTRIFPNGGCGLAWHTVFSPNSSANTNILFGVGRNFDINYSLAVGTYYDENFTSQTLIEQWFQGAWTQVSSPNPGTTGNQLNAVAVGFLIAPWAVGFYTDDNCHCAYTRRAFDGQLGCSAKSGQRQ